VIQNERQCKITQTKLRELEWASANIGFEDPNLHPRQILSQKNSYDRIIGTLKQEIAEYEELKRSRIAVQS
jgi:HTH-type transcriptional regulator / antitoxin HipB